MCQKKTETTTNPATNEKGQNVHRRELLHITKLYGRQCSWHLPAPCIGGRVHRTLQTRITVALKRTSRYASLVTSSLCIPESELDPKWKSYRILRRLYGDSEGSVRNGHLHARLLQRKALPFFLRSDFPLAAFDVCKPVCLQPNKGTHTACSTAVAKRRTICR